MLPQLKKFPGQAGLLALLIYLLSFSHGMTVNSLTFTAKLAGWDWQPIATQPLLGLVTIPVRMFPAGWIPVALNLLAAVAGAFIIGLLARTMELLEWDRPLTVLSGWARRLPLIIACALCGLEFNFWQQSTAMTGEIFQLVPLAAATWCLMEFRACKKIFWLRAAAFIWGLGMAENWMMIMALPVFIVAMFWLGKWQIFSGRIAGQFVLTGLAGFSALAIIPLINSLTPGSPWGFFEAWRQTLHEFKAVLAVIYYNFWRAHRLIFIAVGIFYLVPLIPMIVRLRDEGTASKAGVDQFQIWLYRAMQFALLLVCVWLLFNPVVGPQQIVAKQTGLTMPFLSLNYLLAICAGFLSGNLLIALVATPENAYQRPSLPGKKLSALVVPLFLLLLMIFAGGLILRNAGAITLPNRLPLSQFGKLAGLSLPAAGGIILSDDSHRLFVFEAANKNKNWISVNSRMLTLPDYRRWMNRRFPNQTWMLEQTNLLTPIESLRWLAQTANSNQVHYLHPSFGYFFEMAYLTPTGSTYQVKMYSEQSVNPPPPSEGALAAQEQFWRETAPRLDEIEHSLPATGKTSGRIAGKIYSRLHLQPAPVIQAQLLGEWYSLALNDYGVQLQRAGRLDAASEFFIQAGKLNPNNGAVRVNLQCNASLRTNGLMNLSAVDIVNSQLGNFGVLTRFLTLNGMIDEPSFCYVLGSAFLRVSQPRQALQQFERATQLAPAVIAPKLALAELYTRLGFGPKARELINQIRKDSASLKDSADLEDGLSLLEADTWLAQTNKANAREALQTLANSNNENPRTQNLILRAFMAAGDYKNALGFVNRQLAAKPNDVVSLINRATIEVNMGAPQNAVLTLKKAIAITNAFDIRLLLDSARVEAGQLNAAESDYLEIKKAGQFLPAIMNGLSEIARRRGDTNRAVELLKQAITSLPPGSPLIAPMTKRLEELNRR